MGENNQMQEMITKLKAEGIDKDRKIKELNIRLETLRKSGV